ncbi:MAG: TolC family protein [Bacteroidales bacterium]|nr:TolC family protein [Bacteroidales bacterium]
MKLKLIILIACFLVSANIVKAQEKWDLDKCISYAMEHNFDVRKQLLSLESEKINLNTTQMSRLPNLYASLGQNFDFGRAQTANNVIIDNNSQTSTSLGVGTEIPVFQGFKINRQIKSQKLGLDASFEDLQQAKENLSLNITAYYLSVLLNKEVLNVADEQVALSELQVENIQKLVNSGKKSDSELYEAKATLANDKLSAVKAANNYKLSKLDLAQLMNIANANNFDIIDPSDEINNLINTDINLQYLLDSCISTRPAIKAAMFRIAQGHEDIRIQKSNLYPYVGFSASWGTGYYYTFKQDINSPFGEQLNNNMRGLLSLSMSIPIFNRCSTRNNIKLSQIDLQNKEIALEETKLNLVKEIYQAYNNATASKDQYISAKVAVEASKKSLDYAQVKFESGKSTNLEYDEAKSKYITSQLSEIQAKYEYIIRYRIIEFYQTTSY